MIRQSWNESAGAARAYSQPFRKLWLGWPPVMRYSERHAPKHAPSGAEIPSGVRRALLSWLANLDIPNAPDHREIWRLLRQRIAYGTPQDVVEDVEARFGSDAAQKVMDAFAAEMKVRRPVPLGDQNRYAVAALTTIPAPLFLDALEFAVDLLESRGRVWSDGSIDYVEFENEAAVEEINRLFAVRGISYRFDEEGLAHWHGDEGAFTEIVAPALAALEDPRLNRAAQEFGDALRALRQGGREGNKNAVRDASNAVETAMKTVLDAYDVTREGNETANKLWDLLNTAGLVAEKTQDAICAAPRLGNAHGRHGPNPQPDHVPEGIPEFTVQAAAAALVYLARLLP